jgi:hypothetical protein
MSEATEHRRPPADAAIGADRKPTIASFCAPSARQLRKLLLSTLAAAPLPAAAQVPSEYGCTELDRASFSLQEGSYKPGTFHPKRTFRLRFDGRLAVTEEADDAALAQYQCTRPYAQEKPALYVCTSGANMFTFDSANLRFTDAGGFGYVGAPRPITLSYGTCNAASAPRR